MTDHGKHLRALSIATVVTLTAGLLLAFLYAPQDATLGYIQKIFYLHVPLAIVSLVGFVVGGGYAIAHLRTGERVWDMRSYCAIHMSLIFAVAALISGSIWAKGSWGHWWVWQEPTLVSYLIVILLFATYQPLRFSIEDPERQSRYASVFAIVGAAFIPLNFIAVRLAVEYVHPRVLTLEGGHLPAKMALAFYVALAGIALLFTTLMKYEMAAKTTRMQTRRLRRQLHGEDSVRPLGRSAAPS
jgi:heme exporter protein C